jgi:hypothetical protein
MNPVSNILRHTTSYFTLLENVYGYATFFFNFRVWKYFSIFSRFLAPCHAFSRKLCVSQNTSICFSFPAPCQSEEFFCNDTNAANICIDERLTCDGTQHCSDNSDELNCSCKCVFSTDRAKLDMFSWKIRCVGQFTATYDLRSIPALLDKRSGSKAIG